MSDDDPHGDAAAGPDSGPARGPVYAPTVILDGLPDAVVAVDAQLRIAYANPRAEAMFGWPAGGLVGRPAEVMWPPRLRRRYTENARRDLAGPPASRSAAETWGVTHDGSEFPGEMTWGRVDTDRGSLLLAIGRDISDRRAREARLRAVIAFGERALLDVDAAELAADAVALVCDCLPVSGAEVRRADGVRLAHRGRAPDPGLRVAIGGGDALHLATDHDLDDEALGIVRALANTLAAGMERLRESEQVRWEAVHDPLTGLANRTLLHDRLRQAGAKAARTGSPNAVLFVDLDWFKAINDRHGHRSGDAVLAELARRLRGTVRPFDTVARYGGDEFVAICEGIDEATARAIGERILVVVRSPFRPTAGLELSVSASVGIALGLGPPEALLLEADALAYRAKAAGRARVEFAASAA